MRIFSMVMAALICGVAALCGGCARSINLESTSPNERNFKLSAYEFMDPFTNVVKDIKAGMEKTRNPNGPNTDSITLNGTENIDRSGQVAVANKTIDLAGQIIQAYLASQTGGASGLLSKGGGSGATPSAGPLAADGSVQELKDLIAEVKAMKAANSSAKKAP
jgi:hypothetical protein